MIFGKIKKDEKIIKFNVKMQCVNCNKQVPGGMKSSENYFNTHEFNKELEKFQKIYLCGICRDKKRTNN
ncbi:MAG: hypothetical protein ACKVJ0_05135 [Nitrosopumilus sp.]|jgi:hypothetical protein|tara:strand:+ start:266 stop:472 length:207 start_codon:yes stop_codon:yes gene_type:complete